MQHSIDSINEDDAQLIEEKLRLTAVNHPLTLDLRARNPDIKTSRSVLAIDPIDLPFSLTNTTLSGPDNILAPFVFADDITGCLVAFYHLGSKLAGHAGIVHGGIPAVLLDECMGRACFPRLPNKVAFTAKLELNYKAPIRVSSNIVIEANTTDIEGRKAWVEAKVRDASDGKELIWAKALFIEPSGQPSLRQLI
ncbi:hypothetical protein NQ176_g949 [Zarea fungicola]|uniref:Uncharacterized protein n=1 Tax=Zarea fungicola TaxID=93591 RepID=A0ACC1NUT7_9HYPO|nr:hypothetical protein NQ176_g949 [Lecanicillium fungicola]